MPSMFQERPTKGDISPCLECPYYRKYPERVFSILHITSSAADQVNVPREERSSVSLAEVSLFEKGSISANLLAKGTRAVAMLTLPDDADLELFEMNNPEPEDLGDSEVEVFLYGVDCGIERIAVPSELMDEFAAQGCPGPIEGERKFLFGPKQTICSLVGFVRENQI